MNRHLKEANLEPFTVTAALNQIAEGVHKLNHVWWYDEEGNKLDRNKGEMIALMHSELSEMLEGVRKGLQDSHLPEFTAEEMELADTFIRGFDYAGAHGLRLGEAIIAKLEYNRTRADHTYAARAADGGKKF